MNESLSLDAAVAEFAAIPALLREILVELRALAGRSQPPALDPEVPRVPSPPRDLLTSAETAELLRIDPQTLAVWRLTGRHHDLPFVKMGSGGTGGRVYYRRSDLEAFIAKHLFQNTTQAGVGLQRAKDAYNEEVCKRPNRHCPRRSRG